MNHCLLFLVGTMSLTSCAMEATVLGNRTKFLEGQLRVIDAVTAKNGKEIQAVRDEAEKAHTVALNLEREAVKREETLFGLVDKVAKIGASLIPGGSVIHSIAKDIAIETMGVASNTSKELAKAEASSREERTRMEKSATTAPLKLLADVTKKFEALSSDTKAQLATSVTQEKVDGLIQVASLGDRAAFDKQLQAKFALSEKQMKELGEWSMEEILAMLAGLLGAAAGGTAGGRLLSKSGQKIDGAIQKVEDLKTHIASTIGIAGESTNMASGARPLHIDAKVNVETTAKSKKP